MLVLVVVRCWCWCSRVLRACVRCCPALCPASCALRDSETVRCPDSIPHSWEGARLLLTAGWTPNPLDLPPSRQATRRKRARIELASSRVYSLPHPWPSSAGGLKQPHNSRPGRSGPPSVGQRPDRPEQSTSVSVTETSAQSPASHHLHGRIPRRHLMGPLGGRPREDGGRGHLGLHSAS